MATTKPGSAASGTTGSQLPATETEADTVDEGIESHERGDDAPTAEELAAQDKEREEAEEAKREAGLGYANKLHTSESTDPQYIDTDEDMDAANWLTSQGYAEMHAIQEGSDVSNYILLTEDGKVALQTYNPS